MPKIKNPTAKRFDVQNGSGGRIALRADAPLSEQLAKLETLYACSKQRVVEILVAQAIETQYNPLVSEARSLTRLAEDGSSTNSADIRAHLVSEYGINADAAAQIEAQAARMERHPLNRNAKEVHSNASN